MFRPDFYDKDMTKTIEELKKKKIDDVCHKVGKANLNDKKNLIEILNEIRSDVNLLTEVSARESVYIKPLVEKLNLDEEYKLFDILSKEILKKGQTLKGGSN